jgi:hypothetical protein
MEANTAPQTLTKSEFRAFLDKGVHYDRYRADLTEALEKEQDPKMKEYILLNQHRMNRVEKTYLPSEEVLKSLGTLNHKTFWLVITEPWCGDSAQNLPVFQKLADLSGGNIELSFLYRDENPVLMDAFLTKGSRSIPKLVQLDSHLNVNGIWGPRPTIAQKLVAEWKANPETAADYSTHLHLWYAKDKQKSLEAEILKLLAKANMFCQDCLAH